MNSSPVAASAPAAPAFAPAAKLPTAPQPNDRRLVVRVLKAIDRACSASAEGARGL